MFSIPSSERFFLCILLALGLFFSAVSYHNKITSIDMTLKEAFSTRSININTATLSEIESLPGIGPVLARDIISYRGAAGGFKNIGELRNVKGIGSKKLENIKDLINISE